MSDDRMVAGLEHLARHFVQAVRDQRGYELEYNHTSVKWLDGYVESIRGNYGADPPPPLIQSIGAFLGACIIATYGGRWARDDADGEWGVALPVNGGDVWVLPFNKTYKHFAGGSEHSVGVFFEAIPSLLDPQRDWLAQP